MISQAIFLDSRFRCNDRWLTYFVILAKAGIQEPIPRIIELLRFNSFENTKEQKEEVVWIR